MSEEDYGPCPNCGSAVMPEDMGLAPCGCVLCWHCQGDHEHPPEPPKDTKND